MNITDKFTYDTLCKFSFTIKSTELFYFPTRFDIFKWPPPVLPEKNNNFYLVPYRV